MSVSATYSVWCDGDCCQWVASAGSPREARREAAARGWKRVRVGEKTVDLCPDHATVAYGRRAQSLATTPTMAERHEATEDAELRMD